MQSLRFLLLNVLVLSLSCTKIHKFISIECEAFIDNAVVNLCEVTGNGTIEISFNLLQPETEIFVIQIVYSSNNFKIIIDDRF